MEWEYLVLYKCPQCSHRAYQGQVDKEETLILTCPSCEDMRMIKVTKEKGE